MSARVPEARRRARAALGLPADAAVVGAVGRADLSERAPEDFLAAMQELDRPGVIGVWVGGGELAERVRRRAGRLRNARVVLAGERTDVLDVSPGSTSSPCPAVTRACPTVVVEAMICGVPVIATTVNAVSDLVIPGETGLLVPPQRPRLLASAIRYLLDSPEAAARMAVAARDHLGDRCDEPSLRTALAAAYAPLVPAGLAGTARIR